MINKGMNIMVKKKLGLLTNIPTPYAIAFFNNLERFFDLTVFFLKTKFCNRKWDNLLHNVDFNYVMLDSKAITLKGKDVHYFIYSSNLLEYLKNKNFDAFLSWGWDSFCVKKALKYCKKKDIPFMLLSGSTDNEKSIRRIIFRFYVKEIVRKADILLAHGIRSKEYLKKISGRDDISVSYLTVDNKAFINKIKESKRRTEEIKKRYKIPKKNKVILFCGQFIHRKGFDLLLSAFKRIKKKHHNTTLLAVGTGPLLDKFKEITQKNKDDDVVFTGFVQPPQIFDTYAISDLLVMPSREEVWGLVVNEAMCASIPVIVSSISGCVPDLIENGRTGFVFETNNQKDLYSKLDKILNDEPLRKKMGIRAFEKIKSITPENSARSILNAYNNFIKRCKKEGTYK
jgi:glycosyltransferase involved in cell wall biosynthesis